MDTGVERSQTSISGLSLTADHKDHPTKGVYVYSVTLQNQESEPILIKGPQPIAIQYRITEKDWWTIYGNPNRFTPPETVTLEPEQLLEWEIGISTSGISGPGFSLAKGPMLSGTYRFVYWGTPSDKSPIGIHLPIDFDYGW
jgi:hypothetical protein